MEYMPWEDTLSVPEIRAILRLGDGEEFETVGGVVWMRFITSLDGHEIIEDEFKVSPHGDSMPDLESEWVRREDVKSRLQNIEQGNLHVS